MNKGATFFKFFITEINSIDMKIPIAFTQHIEEELPEKLFLRDRNNEMWLVKIAKVGGSWCFVDGWDKFVNANKLTTGDVMVFEYLQKGFFNVKLYGLSGTEKFVDGPSTHKSEKMSKQSSKYDDISMGRGHLDLEDKDEEIEGDEDALVMPKENRCEEVEELVFNNDAVVIGRNIIHKRYKKRDCYKMEIFEAGLAEWPTNPYFIAKIMPKRTHDLFIPHDVIKDYGLNLGDEIILVDPSGREFPTKCRKWKDGRSVLSGGWTSLYRVNNVALEDMCIFEFVSRENDPRQFLHVTFIRSNTIQN